MTSPWILAARLRTLPASVAPVLVGTALAVRQGMFDLPIFLVTLATALLLQVGANYANDVFDYLKGADRQRVGPMRVTQSGLLTPRQMLIGTGVVFGLAALLGVYLVLIGGAPIALVGIASIVFALAYTAGPVPLAYRGLGEVAAFLFFGLIAVGGTYYLQTRTYNVAALVAGLPQACLAAAILVVNNLRDLDTDRAAGKRTLAVRLGDRATRVEYLALLSGAFLSLAALRGVGGIGWGFALPWLAAPLAARLGRALWQTPRSPALNPILAQTAQLNLVFAVLLAAGLLLPI
ncbi:MAG: 1,4-dihydroxy-2-naphthoate polyprenyltransferase [Anaerolineae bacterium]|nr:1,4-dihydroxy-2-naphthoate polyprenyltransferase [Anaerolineae bacterium]